MQDIDLAQMHRSAKSATKLLKALSNETRLIVLCQLVDGEKSVGELMSLVGIGQSALSQHLARLREDGLVRTRREAQTIYYALEGDEARRVLELLYAIYCQPAGLC